MKVLVPIVAFAGLAAAADQQPAVDTIIQALKNIISTTQTLTTAILGFQSLAQATDLLTANTAVLTAVNNGTDAILQAPQVRLTDSLELTPYVLQLSALTNKSISAIISKKSTFVNVSLGMITYQSIEQLSCASDRFTNATNSRLPGGGISAASAELSAPIFNSFQQGIAAYKDQSNNMSAAMNCSTVNGTSRGLNPADVISGAGMLHTSNGVAVVLAATLAGLMMI